MEESKRRDLDRWTQNGFLPALLNLAKSYTAPIFWSDLNHPVMHSGTVVFLHTGERLVGVTAAHVFRSYARDFQAATASSAQIGNITLHGTKSLIDIDDKLDLAVLDVSEVFIGGTMAVPYTTALWPPAPAQVGEVVLLGGYPAVRRSESCHTVEFQFWSLLARASSSSAGHSGVLLNLEDSYAVMGSPIAVGTDLGGISGGPVFRYRDAGLQFLELVGFISECGRNWPIVFAPHAISVKRDGSIDRHRSPY